MEQEIYGEAIGYCSYCFDDIIDDQPYVMRGNLKYHKDCYELISPEIDDIYLEEIDGE
jgi:hypothetical protein